MNDRLPALIGKYRTKGILLDSNLLVLLYVGLVGAEWVRKFKRTGNQGFTEKEFFLLERIVDPSTKMVSTPHILTETVNFIRQWKGQARHSALELIAQTIPSFKESRPEAKKLVKTASFPEFGLTDSAILDIRPKKYLILSVDANLVVNLQKKGVDAINFNNLRQLAWES